MSAASKLDAAIGSLFAELTGGVDDAQVMGSQLDEEVSDAWQTLSTWSESVRHSIVLAGGSEGMRSAAVQELINALKAKATRVPFEV